MKRATLNFPRLFLLVEPVFDHYSTMYVKAITILLM